MKRRPWRMIATLVAIVILLAVAKFGSFDEPRVEQPNEVGVPESRQIPQDGGSLDTGMLHTGSGSARAPQPDDSPEDPLSRVVKNPEERREIDRTLARIASGGPYPHRQDGTVFGNREGRLPRQARGYYREYTVDTPGAGNRGARRIVRGDRGETYYTRDHYGTFIRIDEGEDRDR